MIGALFVLAQLGAGSVQFDVRVRPETVYVGQQVTYEAVTMLDAAARAALPQNPSYVPGAVQGVTVYDFPFDTASVHDTLVTGVAYRAFVYRRALFPLTPGSYDVPPATLRYALVGAGADGSAVQPMVMLSPARAFVAVPLPRAGKPIGFSGAVGRFRDSLWTDASPLRVGDTFTLTVRVAGVGNLNLLPRPALDIAWAAAVPAAERVQWDSTGTVVRGAKEFDWVVTPRVAGDLVMPEVQYAYFDPTTRRYATATTRSARVTVAAAGAGAPRVANAGRDSVSDTPLPAVLAFARAHTLVVGIVAAIVVVLVFVLAVFGGRAADREDD